MRAPTLVLMIFVVVGSGVSASQLVTAEIYKTVDKKGHTVYTDLPPADTSAKALELRKTNTVPKTEVILGSAPLQGNQSPSVNYEVSIARPVSGETLGVEERELFIEAGLNQPLQEGDEFDFLIDGKSIEKTAESSVTLTDPPRGEHSVRVRVINGEGAVLAESDPATILVQRPLKKKK